MTTEETAVAVEKTGDLLKNIDWSTAGPKLAIAVAVVLIAMWIGIAVLRKVAKVLLALTALSFCAVAAYLVLSNQVTSTFEIIIASGIVGCIAAIVSIPTLALKKG